MKGPALAALFALAACAPVSEQASGPGGCNNAGFLAVQHAHVNRAEVTLCGRVASVRRIRVTRSGAHRVFLVDVGGGDRIEVDANTDILGDFPIAPGDPATVRGEYYYDGGGREGVHFTHHATGGRHASGFVTVNGRTYR